MSIQLITEWNSAVPYTVGPVFFKKINTHIQAAARLPRKTVRISCSIVHDRTMKQLNTTWRGVSATTDVLAFPYEEQKIKGMRDEYMGEVIISIDQARRQAKNIGHSQRCELAQLYTHGVLHILGYDHDTPSAAQRMYALQRQIVQRARVCPQVLKKQK